MKFFLDNNETEAILTVLRPVFHVETFRTAADEDLQDALDIDLFTELHDREFDAIITRDKNQLANQDEKNALRLSGLHWIGHKDPNTDGINIITCLTAGYLSAFPHVLSEMRSAEGPTAFHVRGVERDIRQRIRMHLI
ncbi:hypothetical protein [Nocardia inohanensis]|uniref:PIN-like domain-containing protein n=1 Tax=Nocardia inohanensis TaxID=209246 RepID=UPI00082DC802|nr:hypothetical protein [Nocardia inohanensis]